MSRSFTSDDLATIVELFDRREYRSNLIEMFKTFESGSVRTNRVACSRLDDDDAEPQQIEQPVIVTENCDSDRSPNLTKVRVRSSRTDSHAMCVLTQALSSTSGVFEKAKQFVCRVFGSVASLDEASSSKRLITDVNTIDDLPQTKRRHTEPSARHSSSDLSLTHCRSDIALTRQSSSSSRSMMVTQIHSILDNIDSVLDKIEAQASNASQRSHSVHASMEIDDGLVRPSTDQLTQTSIEILEVRPTTTNGSGDNTTPVLNETFSTHSVL